MSTEIPFLHPALLLFLQPQASLDPAFTLVFLPSLAKLPPCEHLFSSNLAGRKTGSSDGVCLPNSTPCFRLLSRCFSYTLPRVACGFSSDTVLELEAFLVLYSPMQRFSLLLASISNRYIFFSSANALFLPIFSLLSTFPVPSLHPRSSLRSPLHPSSAVNFSGKRRE